MRMEKKAPAKSSNLALFIEVHQCGVLQETRLIKAGSGNKTVTFGNSRTCTLRVEFGKVPDSLKIFKAEGHSFFVLIEPRLTGFINSGSEFGTISDFLSPEGAISALATIADPFPVKLESGCRGVLQIGEFDILFKLERLVLPKKRQFVLEGAKNSLKTIFDILPSFV